MERKCLLRYVAIQHPATTATTPHQHALAHMHPHICPLATPPHIVPTRHAPVQARGRPLSETHARFYVASVIMALGYLHERHLVYRDLKVGCCGGACCPCGACCWSLL